MKVYEATVIDKCAGTEPISFESHVAVLSKKEAKRFKCVSIDEPCTPNITNQLKQVGLTDEDIHYYFTEDEWRERKVVSGGDIRPYFEEIETEEFKYLIGKRVA